MLVTLIAVGMYLTLIFHFLGSIEFQSTASLPDLDSTVLASFGLGQGAYLTKRQRGTQELLNESLEFLGNITGGDFK